ncbi:hypothetical protein ATANTOWER_011240 [Ataeniobius toweri]|uniref:Uncharacterized protein n=1 Tax=Ataeniobius toweri TaxID=208326 RepID=A0ABU7BYX6_9TELE|nr:hypothetical protein [Ataeniobius toweri]
MQQKKEGSIMAPEKHPEICKSYRQRGRVFPTISVARIQAGVGFYLTPLNAARPRPLRFFDVTGACLLTCTEECSSGSPRPPPLLRSNLSAREPRRQTAIQPLTVLLLPPLSGVWSPLPPSESRPLLFHLRGLLHGPAREF